MRKDGIPIGWSGSGFTRGAVGIVAFLVVIFCAHWFYRRHGADFVAETEISWSFIVIMSLLILSFQFLGGSG